MELYYSALSDVGNVRANNEDNLFAGKVSVDTYLFIVADGMGGHQWGEVASYRAVTCFIKGLKKDFGDKDIASTLEAIVLEVNGILFREGKKNAKGRGMGTTLSALLVQGDQGYLAHVGDSRIYRYRPADEQLEQMTEDHSLVGKLLKEGFITKEEARNHPKRNVLYQSVGLKEGIFVQTKGPFPIGKGEKFLLCTDGLNGDVLDDEIEAFLELNSPSEIVEGLLKKAKKGAAADNITIIAVSTEKDKTVIEEKNPGATFPIPPPSQLRKQRRQKIGFFVLILLLVLLLAAVLYILLRGGGVDSPSGYEGKGTTNSMHLYDLIEPGDGWHSLWRGCKQVKPDFPPLRQGGLYNG